MDRLEKQQRSRRTNNIFGKHGRLGCVFSFGNSREEMISKNTGCINVFLYDFQLNSVSIVISAVILAIAFSYS